MSKMTNSIVIDEDDISESVVRELVEQLGEMPKSFTMELIVTVVVTPLPDEAEVIRLSRPHHK